MMMRMERRLTAQDLLGRNWEAEFTSEERSQIADGSLSVMMTTSAGSAHEMLVLANEGWRRCDGPS